MFSFGAKAAPLFGPAQGPREFKMMQYVKTGVVVLVALIAYDKFIKPYIGA